MQRNPTSDSRQAKSLSENKVTPNHMYSKFFQAALKCRTHTRGPIQTSIATCEEFPQRAPHPARPRPFMTSLSTVHIFHINKPRKKKETLPCGINSVDTKKMYLWCQLFLPSAWNQTEILSSFFSSHFASFSEEFHVLLGDWQRILFFLLQNKEMIFFPIYYFHGSTCWWICCTRKRRKKNMIETLTINLWQGSVIS